MRKIQMTAFDTAWDLAKMPPSKYKEGQTWPKGEFTSGMKLLNSDDRLRRGWPMLREIKVKNRNSMAKYGKEVPSDYHTRQEKQIVYPAGKPLITDAQIRAYRKKDIGNWGGEWMVQDAQPPFWTREKQEDWVDKIIERQKRYYDENPL